MEKIRNFLALMRSGLWLLPTTMSFAAIALALFLLRAPLPHFLDSPKFWWLFAGDIESARGLLSAFLSGMITMTSLVVSITFVILSLAANQLGPRLIWNFITDRQIQIVLGLFVATILYVLVVLRSLGAADEATPHLAITGASLLMILCIAALLFYVHKVARSIIADNVIERINGRLLDDIAKRPSKEAEGYRDDGPLPAGGALIPLRRAGYVQTIDYEKLVEIAKAHDGMLAVAARSGEFVLAAEERIRWTGLEELNEGALHDLRGAVVIGAERSPAQDLGFPIQQLVEIAVRALSPGINDPFTALTVVLKLGGIYEALLSRREDPQVFRDDASAVRVHAERAAFADFLSDGFDPIRRAGARHVSVLAAMARLVGSLASAMGVSEKQASLDFLDRLADTCAGAGLAAADLNEVDVMIDSARRRFGATG